MESGLYIVSTPIGNIEDITLRALRILHESDIILCEDTRVSRKLLSHYNISTKMMSYNEQSNEKMRYKILQMVQSGKVVSLISDAGSPLISDPGYKIVRLIKENNLTVDVISGISSVIASLVISGLPSYRFWFGGFTPTGIKGRRKIFEEVKKLNSTLIFFESRTRLLFFLEDALHIFGNRECCIARELTKLHQDVKLTTIKEAILFYKNKDVKGEIVVLISGEESKLELINNCDLNQIAKNLMSSSKLSGKEATEQLYSKFGNVYSKKHIYNVVNNLKNNT